MQSREQIFELLSEILVREFDLAADQLTEGAELADDLELDSIDAIDIAVRLEEATGLRVADEALRNLRTLGDVVDIVHGGLTSQSS